MNRIRIRLAAETGVYIMPAWVVVGVTGAVFSAAMVAGAGPARASRAI